MRNSTPSRFRICATAPATSIAAISKLVRHAHTEGARSIGHNLLHELETVDVQLGSGVGQVLTVELDHPRILFHTQGPVVGGVRVLVLPLRLKGAGREDRGVRVVRMLTADLRIAHIIIDRNFVSSTDVAPESGRLSERTADARGRNQGHGDTVIADQAGGVLLRAAVPSDG